MLLLVLLGAVLLAGLYFGWRLKRHWENFSRQAAARLEGWTRDAASVPERWHEFDETRHVIHQLIFDTLREINTDIPEIIHQQLPLRVLRKGFPALDVSVFLASHGLRPDEVVPLTRLLLACTGDERSDSLVR